MNVSPSPAGASSPSMSGFLGVACLVLAVALPASSAHALWALSPEGWLARAGIVPPMPLSPWQLGIAFVFGMLPVTAMACGLVRAWQCLRGFVRGEVFGLATVMHLRGFAAAVLCSAVLGLVVPAVLSVVLTWQAPPGKRALVLGIGSSDLLMALVAGIVWQIAAVFTRAVALAEENAQFV